MTLIEKAGEPLAEVELDLGERRTDRETNMRATNEVSKVSKESFTAFCRSCVVGQRAQRQENEDIDLTPKL